MVHVAIDDVCPFGEEVARGDFVVGVEAPARRLAPGEVAELVGPIVVALLKYLLVQACAVESDRLAEFDVVAEGIVARGCPDAVRVIALVEYKSLIVRLIVEENPIAFYVYLTHPEV